MHDAAAMNNIQALNWMLKFKGNVNITNKDHPWTPLHAAAKSGALAAVEWLVQHGANPNVRTKNHNTPGDLAAKYGFANVTAYLKPLEHH